MYSVVSILLLLNTLTQLSSDFAWMIERKEYRYSGGNYREELFRYRLFAPETRGEDDRRPLLVWLHGMGEAGDENLNQLKYLGQLVLPSPWKRENYTLFVLAVQCPKDNPFWTISDPAAGDDMINVAVAILEQTLHDYPIDRDRVYLAGISSGGSGCWEFAMRHPEHFAAVAPMSSDGGDNARVSQIKDIPVWAFHCNRDKGIESVRRTVQALEIAGGKVHLTEIDSSSHDSWTSAFNDHHLLDWLFTQRRGQPSSPPGTIPLMTKLRIIAKGWQWWQVIAQIAIPALLIVAVWNAVRRGRRKIVKVG